MPVPKRALALQHTSAQYLNDQREAPGIGFPSIWRLE
jgi:hypothetical protein